MPVKPGRDTGRETQEEAVQEHDDAGGSQDAGGQTSFQEQERSGSTEHKGGGEDLLSPAAFCEDGIFIEPVIIDQIVYFHGTDPPAASKLRKQIDQDKVGQCQGRGFAGEGEGKGVGDTEQSQKDGSQRLKDQIAEQNAESEGKCAHDQIFQEEKPCHLSVFQSDQDIGAELPAAFREHEAGGVLHQPANDADYHDTGKNDHQRKRSQHGGQFLNL